MKAKLKIIYDQEVHYERNIVQRMINADEAWGALSQIQDIVRKFRKHEYYDEEDTIDKRMEIIERMLNEVTQTISDTRIDELWC